MDTGGKIGHYEVRDRIGAGGMGVVYLAQDTRLDRLAAVKVLNDDLSRDADKLKRFIQEAKAASALNHPNILTIYEIGEAEGHHYIVAEFIRGETLRDRMNSGAISLNDALGIALQIAAALAAAHEAGIVHRDIKPENIIVRDDGLVKVLDFGLAKLTEQRGETAASEDATKVQFNTKPGLVMGTVGYMSPEQARGKPIDARSDIFSLGIVMYELFTGKRPFDGEGHLDVVSSILRDDPTPIRVLQPTLPRHLERIIDKTLRKDREFRYQHIKDLAIDLEDLRDEIKFEAKLGNSSDQMLPAPETGSMARRSTLTTAIRTTRRFTLLHAFIFVLAAAAVVGAVLYFRPAGFSGKAPGTYKTTEVASWTSAPGELFSSARFSPDGRLIAFASTRSGSKNIWVTQTGSTEPIQITNDGYSNTDPVWSAKGDEIAYFSDRSGTPDAHLSGVWRVSALGGTPRFVGALTDRTAELRRWGASGRIYFELGKELHAMDPATGATQKVTALAREDAAFINIAADEKSLVYALVEKDAWRIVTGSVGSERVTDELSGTGRPDEIIWLPEKRRIFYSAAVEGVLQVFAASQGAAAGSRITASETDASVVDASPDGTSILFSSAKEESNLWRVSLAGGQEAPVVRDRNSKLWPSVAPDNSRVAFQSEKNMSLGNHIFDSAIVVRPLRQGPESETGTKVTEHGFLPAWSPDASLIAYVRSEGPAKDLYVVNPNGGSERKLSAAGISTSGYSVSPYNYLQAAAFDWSPAGGAIAYATQGNGFSNVAVVNVRDGTERIITTNAEKTRTFGCPLFSPDGTQLAVMEREAGSAEGRPAVRLRIMNISDGTAGELPVSGANARLLGWTADAKGLIVAEAAKPSGLPPETTLKIVAVGGGSEKVAVSVKNAYYYNIFLSDDRKLIAFAARTDGKDDIWVVPSTGGTPRKLTSNNDSGLYYSRMDWLHDGSEIVFGKQTRFSLLSMVTDID
jgi:eukaryotic-like serine/threonine-protein kinase